jgi:hypothetical protein
VSRIVEPPVRPTGNPDKLLNLTGHLFPWKNIAGHPIGGEPILLNMIGSNGLFLPTFSDEVKLRACMTRAGVEFDKIKQIMDHSEFLDSVPLEIVVMSDAWYTLEGKVRYREVRR